VEAGTCRCGTRTPRDVLRAAGDAQPRPNKRKVRNRISGLPPSDLRRIEVATHVALVTLGFPPSQHNNAQPPTSHTTRPVVRLVSPRGQRSGSPGPPSPHAPSKPWQGGLNSEQVPAAASSHVTDSHDPSLHGPPAAEFIVLVRTSTSGSALTTRSFSAQDQHVVLTYIP
jgi:hypothetical protein